MKRFRPPNAKQDLGKILQRIYDDINTIVSPITTDKDSPSSDRQSNIKVVRDKTTNTYALDVKFREGWVRIGGDGGGQIIRESTGPRMGGQAFTGVSTGGLSIMEINFDIKTTENISGTVTVIPINRHIDVVAGQRLRVINRTNFRIEYFSVLEDQGSMKWTENPDYNPDPESGETPQGTNRIKVVPKTITEMMPAGSYVEVFPAVSIPGSIQAGIRFGREFVQLYAESDSIGYLYDDVDGVVSELPAILFVKIRSGWTLKLLDVTTGNWYTVTVSDEEDQYYEGQVMLPISPPQYITAPKDSLLRLGNTMLSSILHVDPGKILGRVNREMVGESIGTLSADRSGAVTTLALKDIEADIPLLDEQYLKLYNREGQYELVQVNGNQTLTPPTHTLNIKSKTLTHVYLAEDAWIKEPSYRLTGSLVITAGETKILQEAVSTHGTAISGLTLDVSNLNTATATLTTSIQTTNNNLAQAVINLESKIENDIATAIATVYTKSQIDTQFSTAQTTWQTYTDTQITTATASMVTTSSFPGLFDARVATAELITQTFASANYLSSSINLKAEVFDGQNSVIAAINVSADTINGARIKVTGDTEFEGNVSIKGTLTATNWTGGDFKNDNGIRFDFSGGKLASNPDFAVAVKWGGDNLHADHANRYRGYIYAYAVGGTMPRPVTDSILHIAAGVNASSTTDGVGTIHMSASETHFINNGEIYYKGQTLDSRFSGAGTVAWSAVTSKPFDTIGANLEVNSNALRVNNTKAGNWDTAFAERGSQIAGGALTWASGSLNVSFGTSGSVACVGNDSRLSNAREWTASTVTQAVAEAGTDTVRTAWTSQRVRQAANAAINAQTTIARTNSNTSWGSNTITAQNFILS